MVLTSLKRLLCILSIVSIFGACGSRKYPCNEEGQYKEEMPAPQYDDPAKTDSLKKILDERRKEKNREK